MPRIRPAKFVHVVYRTYRFDEMIDWYLKVFDASIQHRHPGIAFVNYDEEHPRVAFLNLSMFEPDGPKGRGDIVGVDHVAYAFNTLRDLFENYAQLKEMGVMPYWCLHHGITISLYYADPDGNRMEFQVDACTIEEANAFMEGPGFAQNPIGVEFEPDDILARVRAGEPEAAFMHRTEHLPVAPLRHPAARRSRRHYGLTADDHGVGTAAGLVARSPRSGRRQGRERGRKSAVAKSLAKPVKFKDDRGNTGGGIGKCRDRFTAELAAGKTRKDLLANG